MRGLTKTLLLAGLVAALVGEVRAQRAKKARTEGELKAGLCYHIARYAKWPAAALAGGKFRVGVVGPDRLGKHLDSAFGNRKVHKRAVTVTRFGIWGRFRQPERLKQVHLLLVTESGLPALRAIKRLLGNAPVVVVGFVAGSTAAGADLEIYVRAKRVRFYVERSALRAKRINVSSRLLKHSVKNPASAEAERVAQSGRRPG